MTPFAMEIVKDVLFPGDQSETPITDKHINLVNTISAGHCFDCSAIIDLAFEFDRQHFPHHCDKRLMFLPDRVTWLEFSHHKLPKGARFAFLLERTEVEREVNCTILWQELLPERGWFTKIVPDVDKFTLGEQNTSAIGKNVRRDGIVAALLTLINQPAGVLHEKNSPHKGMARRIRKSSIGVDLALRPWTRLRIQGPQRAAGMSSLGRSSSGGRKCYHFVRAHFREANGQFVRAHFRGDPALGIGRKSYVVGKAA